MLLIALTACAYFLSQSGFINHFGGGSPQSYTLDWDKIKNSAGSQVNINFWDSFTPEQDVVSGTWLSRFMANGSLIYSDFIPEVHTLQIYGGISTTNLKTLTNETMLESNSYIYLRYFNVFQGLITSTPDVPVNSTEISPILNESDLIYTNGGSQVYASP